MEPALKQRLVGAVVLIALAVIFLPMLIKGPAPESGVSDVPLEAPQAPGDGEFETRELPLLEPGAAPRDGVVGLDGANASARPAVAPATDAAPAAPAATPASPADAAGDYAVSFGSYASEGDAQRVVGALAQADLVAYHERYANSAGRMLHRVRIGPFASEADAEAARVRAAQVRRDVEIRVIALDAAAPGAANTRAARDATAPGTPATASSAVSTPAPLPDPGARAASTSGPAPASVPPTRPANATPPRTAATAPVRSAADPTGTTTVASTGNPSTGAAAPAVPTPAAADTGFAVQLGAFGDAAEAVKLRDRLRGQGFSAFTDTVRTERGTLSRVRVGPVTTRADAERLKAQVAGRVGIDGIVRPHP